VELQLRNIEVNRLQQLVTALSHRERLSWFLQDTLSLYNMSFRFRSWNLLHLCLEIWLQKGFSSFGAWSGSNFQGTTLGSRPP
jgi:hypothetical protein